MLLSFRKKKQQQPKESSWNVTIILSIEIDLRNHFDKTFFWQTLSCFDKIAYWFKRSVLMWRDFLYLPKLCNLPPKYRLTNIMDIYALSFYFAYILCNILLVTVRSMYVFKNNIYNLTENDYIFLNCRLAHYGKNDKISITTTKNELHLNDKFLELTTKWCTLIFSLSERLESC